MDFATQPDECRSRINGFVEEVTKNNIKELLPPGSISTDTKVVLANAAYFKGQWSSKFDKEDTQKKIFYEHSRMPVYVDMMRQRGSFNYGMCLETQQYQIAYNFKLIAFDLVPLTTGVIEQLRTVFLEMPYKGEEDSISMFIFLPVFHVDAIDEMLQNITPEILDEVFRGGLQREVDVEFPKISFERKFELVPVSE